MSDRADVMIRDGEDRFRVSLDYLPPRVQIDQRVFDRVDDPETGKPLGCYVAADRVPRAALP